LGLRSSSFCHQLRNQHQLVQQRVVQGAAVEIRQQTAQQTLVHRKVFVAGQYAVHRAGVNDYLEIIDSHSAGDWELHDNKRIKYPTCGPTNRFSAILFIEKEGFNPLFEKVKLAERYDLAIMSSKGQSVVAARRAVDEICYVGADVPLLILHDFDKQGFEIAQNLTSVSWAAEESGRIRYEFKNAINVIDLGLRLPDVKKWKLESEKVAFTGSFAPDTTATPEERKFLRSGRRVELNAFTSAELIEFIEGKLKQYGIKKVVPDDDTLERAYRRFYQIAHLNENLEDANNEAIEAAQDANLPTGLARKIKKALKDDPKQPWDKVLARIAANDVEAND
jgi:hypothetical protein